MDQSLKSDAGKPRYTLLPMKLLDAVTAVREYGLRKYKDSGSWKEVDPNRYRDALWRHLVAYTEAPGSIDEESGLPHMFHVACNAAFLIELEWDK